MFVYPVILLAFLADRVSKLWVADYLAEHGTTQVHAWVTLRETYNRGIAFGLFQGMGPLVGWLTIAVVVVLFIYLHRIPRRQWLVRLGLAILIGGALGNLVDRIWLGEVLDFIEIPLRVGIFNVADVMIHTGWILAFVGSVWQGDRGKTAVADAPAPPEFPE